MFLKSENIHLRALEPTDLEFLYSLENDVLVWPVSNTANPFSKHVLQQYLDNAAADIYTVRQLRLVIGENNSGQAVGAIDLFDFDPKHLRAGIGIVIGSGFRQKKYATEALFLTAGYAKQHLHLHQLYCSVGAKNTASQQLFLKAGYQQTGLRKDWLRIADGWEDVLEYQKILD